MSEESSDFRRVEHLRAYPQSVWFSETEEKWYGRRPGIRTGPLPVDFALTEVPMDAVSFDEFRQAADFARDSTVENDQDEDRAKIEQAIEACRPGTLARRLRISMPDEQSPAEIIPFPCA